MENPSNPITNLPSKKPALGESESESSKNNNNNNNNENNDNNVIREEIRKQNQEGKARFEEIKDKLAKERGLSLSADLYYYQGFWCPFPTTFIPAVIALQNHFQPQHSDIILASKPKSGTTWLKSLVYSILHRTHFTPQSENHPLLTKNPHELAPFLEVNIYGEEDLQVPHLQTYMTTSPRLFSSHLPYQCLPSSVKDDRDHKCRIVYMARNPFDTFVSLWKFLTRNVEEEELSIEDFFGFYCRGVSGYGPFWDHVLGYWKQSLERPNKVLFLKYEDMKENGVSEMKKLADFLGYGFSKEEEEQGVIDDILKLCSLGNLKEMEVNKSGKLFPWVENNTFFRKGQVGDWVNYFTPSMVEKMDQLVKERFEGAGLEFRTN